MYYSIEDFKDFDSLQYIIAELDGQKSTSEIHGLLTALSLGPMVNDIQPALLEAFPNQDNNTVFRQALIIINEQLQDINFSFNPLLPSDDTEMAHRLVALSEWCKGFLDGLACHNIDFSSQDAKEILQDLQTFSNDLDPESGEEYEEAENAYMEIVEFVKTGVLWLANEALQQNGA